MNQCIDHGKKGNKAGYRSVYVGGGKANPKYDLAHRVALAKELGRALLPDEVARHTCDNPRCVNPKHLVVGSQADNIRDTAGKPKSTVRTRVLTDVEVVELRALKGTATQSELAKQFGISRMAVQQILAGTRR